MTYFTISLDWHRDGGDYIFRNARKNAGVAGHDLPSYATGVIIPLLDVNYEHGPTEFCMGLSHLHGVEEDKPEDIPFYNETLRSIYREIFDTYFEGENHSGCPAQALRIPKLNFGDVLLFDYSMLHRGGHNTSPDLRTLIYNTYTRSWYKDPNWSQPQKALHAKTNGDTEKKEEGSSASSSSSSSPRDGLPENLQQLIRNVRFAVPDFIGELDQKEIKIIKRMIYKN